MRRTDRGVANILVVLLVGIGLVALVLGYLGQAEANAVAQQVNALQAQQAAEKARYDAAFERTKQLVALAGWPQEPFQPEANFDTILDEMQKHRISHLEKRKGPMGLTGPLPDGAANIADLFQGDKAYRDGSTTMERIAAAAAVEIGALEGVLHQAEAQLAIAQSSAKAAQDRMNAILEQKSKEIDVLTKGDEGTKREGLEQLNARKKTVQENYEAAETRKTQQRDQLKDQANTRQTEMTRTINSLMGEISRTIQALEEIQKKEATVRDITRPQGAVLNPQADGLTCYIDLGAQSGLHLGQKFRVFRRGFAGQNVWKAEIEVKRILEGTSLCSVTALFRRNDPIIEGDSIYNPLYNGGTPRRIVVMGDFDGTGVGKDEFARRVKMHGGSILEKIDWDTDFVVLAANVDTGSAAYKEGVQIGVPFVPISQIAPYLGD